MSLQTLPSEVLGLILGYEDCSYFLINLYLCGSSLLSRKLPSSVRQLRLEEILDRVDLATSRAPQLLSTLRCLLCLDITSAKSLVPSSKSLLSLLQGLPKTIETLSFHSLDAQSIDACFLNPVPGAAMISQALPRLTSLSLKGYGSFQDFYGFQSLPSTLTFLAIDNVSITESYVPVMAALPRSLVRLEARIDVLWDCDAAGVESIKADWLQSPPNLKYISHLFVTDIPPPTTQWLPQKIFFGSVNSESSDRLSVQQSYLPTGIHSAVLIITHEPNWETFLPAGIESLTMSAWDTVEVQPPLLPISLRTLDLANSWSLHFDITDDSNENADFWPPRLSDLHISQTWYDVDLEHLPRTLEHLSLQLSLSSPTVNASKFPPNLTSLSLATCYYRSLYYIYGSFPATLTSLDIRSSEMTVGASASKATFELISRTTSLRYLSIAAPNDVIRAGDEPWPLPPHLTSYNVSCWHSKWISSLSASLTNIEIGTLHINGESSTKVFENFPSSTTSLIVADIAWGQTPVLFSPVSFARLPHLRTLSISKIAQFPSSVLRHLPRNLRSLQICFDSLKDEDKAFIPPLLRDSSQLSTSKDGDASTAFD